MPRLVSVLFVTELLLDVFSRLNVIRVSAGVGGGSKGTFCGADHGLVQKGGSIPVTKNNNTLKNRSLLPWCSLCHLRPLYGKTKCFRHNDTGVSERISNQRI